MVMNTGGHIKAKGQAYRMFATGGSGGKLPNQYLGRVGTPGGEPLWYFNFKILVP